MRASFVVVFAAMLAVSAAPSRLSAQRDDFDDDFGRGTSPTPTPTPTPTPSPTPASSTPAAPRAPAPAPSRSTPAPSRPTSAPSAAPSRPTSAPSAAPSRPTAAPAAAPATTRRPSRAPDDEARRRRDLRLHSTLYGATGGFHVVDAGSGPARTFRLSLQAGFSFLNDFLVKGDRDKWIAGVFSLSVTPIRNLEIFASVTARSNYNSIGDPVLIQSLGDLRLGVKAHFAPKPWLRLGGDATLALLNPVGDIGVVWKSTSVGLRGNLTFDFREARRAVPIIARVNAQYYLDNSSQSVKPTEDARYASLDAPLDRGIETRHLVTRIERFALGMNRTDFVNLGVGFELPLALSSRVFLHPIAEWNWAIPVNRQGYVCPYIASTTSTGPVSGRDGCLDVQGVKAFPMTATIGARLYPAVEGLSLTVAADVGITGTRTFVREVAPTMPYTILLGATYAYDPRARGRQDREVVREVAIPPTFAVRGHVVGTVVEQGTSTPIDGVIVRFTGHPELSGVVTSSDGRFVSYTFDPGEVAMEATHPDYFTGTCTATLPATRPASTTPPATATASTPSATPSTAATTASTPASPSAASTSTSTSTSTTAQGIGGAPAAPAPSTPPPDLVVEVRCELPAKPRTGNVTIHVVGDGGAPIAGARVDVNGPATSSLPTDATGNARLTSVGAGSYTARVDAPNHFLAEQAFTVEPRGDSTVTITVLPRPRRPLVQLRGQRITIKKQVNFVTDSDQILPSSDALLTEVADLLLRNAELQHVEVEGHTDDRGGSDHNLDLSQRRADSVRRWLVAHGVEASRLTARGFGSTRPLVPNITSANRARNRRVQFTVVAPAD